MVGRSRDGTGVASAAIGVLLACLAAGNVAAQGGNFAQPVAKVAEGRLPVTGANVTANLPILVSRSWSHPLPDITAALVMVHGISRNADVYFKIGQLAAQRASAEQRTIIVAPQFLREEDAAAHALSNRVLAWRHAQWEGGDDAVAHAISSFDALDAVLARLGNAALFPHLRRIVVAGHSGGGQIVQRYAVLGRQPDELQARGIAVRFVAANPSSYAYFSRERPFGGNRDRAARSRCARADHWKYGLIDLPRYQRGAAPAALEARYVGRDVVYLVGTKDNDPASSTLDRTCMAALQGPHRLARAQGYFDDLRRRHPRLQHRLIFVADVAHDGRRMFLSTCGLSALFDLPGCSPPRSGS